MTVLRVVVPANIDEPHRPSGGNIYDRRVCQGLAAAGWSIREHAVDGDWPFPDTVARARVSEVLAGVTRDPEKGIVLMDGLVASAIPELGALARPLPLVILVHMIVAQGARDTDAVLSVEGAALAAAHAIITTSRWTRDRIVDQYRLSRDRIHVVEPGVDAAQITQGSTDGGRLLCVAAVTPAKGHDLLITALAQLTDLNWHCRFVGALDISPGFVDHLRVMVRRARIDDRIEFAGTRSRGELAALYSVADALVLASREEAYGMVVTEALARGVPVIAASVGGIASALGTVPGTEPEVSGGSVSEALLPGILVPPGDPDRFAAALRTYLSDAQVRLHLRRAARQRRSTLRPWPAVTTEIGDLLTRTAERRQT